jgi:PhzF family phenazine biosynthesis protein
MGVPLYIVDAFTAAPFAGNPAAVCLLATPQPAAWMQQVAREMQLSETAFLVPAREGFDLRWFTPVVEVSLCGHATLASAHVLWETERLAPDAPAQFHTRSGLLTAVRRAGDWIELDFPARPPTPADPPAGLLAALGVEPLYVGRNQDDYLIVVPDEATVRRLAPDGARLRQLPARGVIVSAPAAPPYDFVSRFFAPAVGIDEDPVTGSAHCCLAPYWAERLGRNPLRAYQASPRGGTLEVEWRGTRVALRGQAVTVLRGELLAG